MNIPKLQLPVSYITDAELPFVDNLQLSAASQTTQLRGTDAFTNHVIS